MKEQEKVKYVNAIYPQLSSRAQRYLYRIAEAMLFIQDPALSPVYIDQQEEKRKENEVYKN
jgi:hypothetical protein